MLPRLLVLLAAVAVLTGCGDDGLHYDLKTPAALPGDVPLAPKGQKLVDVKPTASDIAKAEPVIKRWTQEIRDGKPAAAASHFDLPTVVSAPDGPALQINTPGVAAAYSASMSCLPELVKLAPVGRFLVGDFVQRPYPGRPCADKGQIEKIGFVFGNPDHPDRFTELWTAPPSAKAETGPAERPTDGIPVQAQQLVPFQ